MCVLRLKLLLFFYFQPLSEWTSANVVEWMAALNLYRYADVFKCKDIKGSDLVNLDKDKLLVSTTYLNHISCYEQVLACTKYKSGVCMFNSKLLKFVCRLNHECTIRYVFVRVRFYVEMRKCATIALVYI